MIPTHWGNYTCSNEVLVTLQSLKKQECYKFSSMINTMVQRHKNTWKTLESKQIKIYTTEIKLLTHKTVHLKVKFGKKKKMVNKDTVTSHHTTHITDFSANTTTF